MQFMGFVLKWQQNRPDFRILHIQIRVWWCLEPLNSNRNYIDEVTPTYSKVLFSRAVSLWAFCNLCFWYRVSPDRKAVYASLFPGLTWTVRNMKKREKKWFFTYFFLSQVWTQSGFVFYTSLPTFWYIFIWFGVIDTKTYKVGVYMVKKTCPRDFPNGMMLNIKKSNLYRKIRNNV
jgi:hypothetical protein